MNGISVASFLDKKEHLRILALMMPMVLANITTPLLGLVDTAVLGHMSASHYLAGASIGALILTQLYWICGFIRMASTGLSAQAKGADDPLLSVKGLIQNGVLALLIGFTIIALQSPLLQLGIVLADAESALLNSIVDYYEVRVWGAPAAMLNLALIGWLIGQQHTRIVMYVQVFANLLNVILDLWFVYGLGWEVSGVAAASVIAEYSITAICLWAIFAKTISFQFVPSWLKPEHLTGLFSLNVNMLMRNLLLQLCLAFITYQGARLGSSIAATNAILMQFFVLIALGLDAVAYAVEALVGEKKGANDRNGCVLATLRGLAWSMGLACLYALLFAIFGKGIIGLLTDQPELVASATLYLSIIIWLPVIAHWCFLFDGVYVGLTEARIMRNSMLASALGVFFPVWWLLNSVTDMHGNVALWIALLCFLAARGLTLGGHFIYQTKTAALVD